MELDTNLDVNDLAPDAPEPGPAAKAHDAAMKSLADAMKGEPDAPPAPKPAAVATKPAEPPVAAVPDPKDVDIANRIAEIVRAEAALVGKQQAQRAEVDAARAELKRAADELAEMRRQLLENPLELLKANKWELEDIVKVAATKQTPEAVRAARLEAEVAELKRRDAERDNKATAAEQQRVAADAHERLMRLIPEQVAIIKDETPLLHAWYTADELRQQVYAVMGQEFQRTKGASTLEPAEAARKLEQELRSRVERVSPDATVTQRKQPTSKQPPTTVKPSVTVTNASTQHRNTQEVPVKPGDINALRKRALDAMTEAWGKA